MKQFLLYFYFFLISFIHCNNANDNANDQLREDNEKFESDSVKLMKNIYKMVVIKAQENTKTAGGIKNSISNKIIDHLERRKSIYNKNGGNELKYLKSKISEKSKSIKNSFRQNAFVIKKFVEDSYNQANHPRKSNENGEV
jgi:hypothetical protein